VIPAESVDVIRMSWQPEAADYAEAFQARNRRRHVGWLAGAMCVFGIAFAVLAVVGGQPAMAVFGVVTALFFAVMGKLGTGFLYRRNPALQQPVHVIVDPGSGIAGHIPVVTMGDGPMKVNAGNWQFPWAQLHSVLETKRGFVLHVAGQNHKTFFLLAKRGLPDAAQESALRRLLPAER
jgi:YcxB-like protein